MYWYIFGGFRFNIYYQLIGEFHFKGGMKNTMVAAYSLGWLQAPLTAAKLGRIVDNSTYSTRILSFAIVGHLFWKIKVALSVCRGRSQILNWQCRSIDDINIIALSTSRCRIKICEKFGIYTVITSVWRRIVGWDHPPPHWRRGFASNPVCCICFYFLSLVGY
jgi:hypothetical protein